MPGIVVFRRRWMVASDDFVIPFTIAFVVRGIWLIILGVSMILFHGFQHQHHLITKEENVCEQTVDYFIGGYLALLFATEIMELSVAWMSGKGSLMDTEPRNFIPALLYVRLMLSIIEVVWLAIGVKWIFLDTQVCPLTDEIYIARAVVVFNWMFLFIVTVIILCTFDTAGRTWFAMQRARDGGHVLDSIDAPCKYRTRIAKKYESRWKGCFRYAFCCIGAEGQGDENVYAFIGRTLAEFFQDLDVVPSDFAAGLVLLRRHQKCEEHQELERALQERRVQEMTTDGVRMKKSSLRYQRTSNARVLNLNNKEEFLLYKEIAYFMNHALAAYGWPIYMKNHVLCGCCKLGKSFRCCYGCRNNDSRLHKIVQVDEDNCCRCHFSALKRIAGLHNTDVIYVSYHNSLYKSPFYVALDHHKKAVVVVIRGTLSLQDILTDFTVEPERIPAEGGDPSWFGHKGMVRCAVYIQRKLENDGILHTAFNADPDCGTRSYRLVLLGHSLGAGTAAILAFLLRPRYPDLFCYAYSPPGANLSLSAAKYARDFVISIVIGKDLVPRLSLFTLEDLRNKIMTLITRSRIPKWKILRGCACRCAFVCCAGCRCVNIEGHQHEIDGEVQTIQIPEITHSNSMRFFPPGRIMHVVKTVSVSRGCGQKETMFEPVWADLEDFQNIKISGLMWMDHMPDFVLEALNKCLPTKEQEQSIMNGRGIPIGHTLDVPHTAADWYCVSRMEDSISYRSDDVEEYSVEVPGYPTDTPPGSSVVRSVECSGSKDSLSVEVPVDASLSEHNRAPSTGEISVSTL
ncbi:diacylglycerol lipase-alpha isoform X2 [Nematostella vectensis]|uniref:diacylglycerol lipase-alpha isoform X2 n=1 Tax=Nematostella vectensis TaxID=45351 RepID=UPI002077259D|nr:diacylglycerol lipase-alpha isoform X2 [Nematostella vectensis]